MSLQTIAAITPSKYHPDSYTVTLSCGCEYPSGVALAVGDTYTCPRCPVTVAATVAAALLAAAATAQTAYWDALRALETALGVELDDVGELDGLTVDDLLESYGPDGLAGSDDATEPGSLAARVR